MNCDPIARWYRWLEYAAFGRALERRRVAFLDQIADAQKILVLGDGDGRFLARLAEQNRSASIVYVDLSAEMLAWARKRCRSDRVSFHQANALKFPLGEYDLVCTHFFLDCLNEKEAAALVARVAASLKPGARWLISEFRDPAPWARSIVQTLYFFFRWTTGLRTRELIDYRRLLERAGFQMSRCESARAGLLVSELWITSSDTSPEIRER